MSDLPHEVGVNALGRLSSDLGAPPSLEPCPFCGQPLTVRWRRSNPKASCQTAECWGGKLPVLPLDVPCFVAAWNKRPSANELKQVRQGFYEGIRCVLTNLRCTDSIIQLAMDGLPHDEIADYLESEGEVALACRVRAARG